MEPTTAKRFWVPRGINPAISDEGFLVDPESDPAHAARAAVPFSAIEPRTMLALLGGPGMGKSTSLSREINLGTESLLEGDRLFALDLGLCGSEFALVKSMFRATTIRTWNGKHKLHLFLDSYDECLQRIDNLVALTLNFLAELPHRDQLVLRIACRTADLATGPRRRVNSPLRGKDAGRL